VYQFYNLIPTLTVEENLLLPLELNGWNAAEARAAVGGLLAEVGLGDRAGTFPDRLSGGEQQRVAIARAPRARPDAGAGRRADRHARRRDRRKVLDLFSRLLRARGKTLLIVTHSKEVTRFAERVLTLEDGSSPPTPRGGVVTTLTRRAAARHFARHPWQFLLTVLGVALGVAVVVAVDWPVTRPRAPSVFPARPCSGAPPTR